MVHCCTEIRDRLGSTHFRVYLWCVWLLVQNEHVLVNSVLWVSIIFSELYGTSMLVEISIKLDGFILYEMMQCTQPNTWIALCYVPIHSIDATKHTPSSWSCCLPRGPNQSLFNCRVPSTSPLPAKQAMPGCRHPRCPAGAMPLRACVIVANWHAIIPSSF